MSHGLLGDPPLTTRRRGTVLVVDDEEGVRASIRAGSQRRLKCSW